MYFDINRAQKVRDYIEKNLKLTTGEWQGEPFKLLNWEWEEIIKPLFGTLQYEGGPRQYRICYVEVPKKNGKTELSAAIALYMLDADGEKNPHVYCAACDRNQAGYIFNPAAYMVRHNRQLDEKMKVLDSRREINYKARTKTGFLKVLSSDVKTKHGLNPSCIVFDELHAQPNDELWRVLTVGTDSARSQQLIFVMSTAGIFDKESIWWRVREKARQIKAGIIEDLGFLPVLYLADPEKDNSEDRKLWERVNPSLGHIFTMEKLETHFRQAKDNPIDYQDFLRFRLDIPIKQLSRWMPMGAWDKCGGTINEKELLKRHCYGGLDLSSKQDLTAFLLVFPPVNETDKYIVIPKFYVPEDSILQRSKQDRVHYDIWAGQGFIKATPGNAIDTEFIKKDVIDAASKYLLKDVGYDPWGAMDLANQLQNEEGITMTEMRQGTKTLSEPAKAILVKVLEGGLNHGNHPVLRWCTDNLVMKSDANENVQPAKDKATDRIDGFVALIMAWGRMLFGEKKSVYEDRGIRSLG